MNYRFPLYFFFIAIVFSGCVAVPSSKLNSTNDSDDTITPPPNNASFSVLQQSIPPELFCDFDSDCVPLGCCHPFAVVNRDHATKCDLGIGCTAMCSGPLECGCGSPACVNHTCDIRRTANRPGCPWYNQNGTVGEPCREDVDCSTPFDYIRRSTCHYTSLCLDGVCSVVCPQNLPEEPSPACTSDSNCSCNRFFAPGQCKCVNTTCMILVENASRLGRLAPEDYVPYIQKYPWELELVFGQPITHDNFLLASSEYVAEYGDKIQINPVFYKGIAPHDGLIVRVEENYVENVTEFSPANFSRQSVYFKRVIDNATQRVPSKNSDLYYCTSDQECVSVPAGCCSCSSGGSAVTINGAYSNYWVGEQKQKCSLIMCPAVMSHSLTCGAKPKCISNACAFGI